jgi:hypothetical protein
MSMRTYGRYPARFEVYHILLGHVAKYADVWRNAIGDELVRSQAVVLGLDWVDAEPRCLHGIVVSG